eukprot:1159312-Pelagomonas_calceolata.AAC.8
MDERILLVGGAPPAEGSFESEDESEFCWQQQSSQKGSGTAPAEQARRGSRNCEEMGASDCRHTSGRWLRECVCLEEGLDPPVKRGIVLSALPAFAE